MVFIGGVGKVKKRNIIFIFLLCLFMFGAIAFAMENKQVGQEAIIGGTVSKIVTVGTVVNSGDSLVDISTLTGTASACRATVDGTVEQVLVNVGDNITSGQIVVYIKQ